MAEKFGLVMLIVIGSVYCINNDPALGMVIFWYLILCFAYDAFDMRRENHRIKTRGTKISSGRGRHKEND